MAELTSGEGRRGRRIDPLAMAAAVFFALALVFGAYPAFRAGPASIGGLLLLLGLAGVAFFTILALRGSEQRGIEDLTGEAVVDALAEPAALISSDGRVLCANAVWATTVGPISRLPKPTRSGGLFAAIAAARRGQAGVVEFAFDGPGGGRTAQIGVMGARRFLVRLLAPAAEETLEPVMASALEIPAAVVVEPPHPAPPAALDVFAAAAPFGAALLHGEDPAAAVIGGVNETFLSLTGGGDPTGMRLADLIEPASWAEAAGRIAERRNGPIEVRLAHAPERITHLYLTRSTDGFVAFLVDVSEQKQVEL
ncbi:MAG: hybrid sensor histidine kinase/response regulator, partial [Caulobacteraceae bacterium]|nr:hybrid sensor histidine kinase/response regulator [Caulobacteraceae bacterium]